MTRHKQTGPSEQHNTIHTQKKPTLRRQAEPGLVAFYDKETGNRSGKFSQLCSPHGTRGPGACMGWYTGEKFEKLIATNFYTLLPRQYSVVWMIERASSP